jgi:hypothetical protein
LLYKNGVEGKKKKYIISNLVSWLTNHGLYFIYNITNKFKIIFLMINNTTNIHVILFV